MKRVKLSEFGHQAKHFFSRVVDDNIKVKMVDEVAVLILERVGVTEVKK